VRTEPELETATAASRSFELDVLTVAPPEPEAPPTPHWSRAWLHRHRLSLAVLTVLLAGVAIVHGIGMSRTPVPLDDEGTYLTQAWALLKLNTLSHYTFTYDHPPAGTIVLAIWLGVSGALGRASYAIAAGREFMLLNQLVASALLFAVCRRLGIRRTFAALGVVLFTVSPLALDLHRAVYLDNLVTPWLLGSLMLALSPRRHLLATAGSALCFAVAVLMKETTLLVLPPVVYAMWQHADRRTRRMSLTIFATVLATVLCSYPLYALLKGELFPGPGHVSLVDGLRWQLFDRVSSGNVFEYGTQANILVTNWLKTDSWLLLLGALTVPIGLASKRLRPIAVAVAILGIAVLRGGYLPIPFILSPIVFIPILVAGVTDWAWTSLRQPRLVARVVAVVGLVTMAGMATQAAPVWARGVAGARNENHSVDLLATEQWLTRHAPRDSRIVTDDTFWLDLVRAGFARHRIIWHEKLDVDPAVMRRLPDGWRSVNYLVLTSGMRAELAARSFPSLEALVSHSRVVHSAGIGGNVTEIRQVFPNGVPPVNADEVSVSATPSSVPTVPAPAAKASTKTTAKTTKLPTPARATTPASTQTPAMPAFTDEASARAAAARAEAAARADAEARRQAADNPPTRP
jgi:hypothetical protein